jgi:large subunit ribosomal protein L19
MRQIVKELGKEQLRSDVPDFDVGDTVRVSVQIIEGQKTRIQDFEGIVIARKHRGARETFTVRKISSGVGVERIFPLNSPRIVGIKITRKGKVRRAKLYYLRKRVGKKARIRERAMTAEEMKAARAAEAELKVKPGSPAEFEEPAVEDDTATGEKTDITPDVAEPSVETTVPESDETGPLSEAEIETQMEGVPEADASKSV